MNLFHTNKKWSTLSISDDRFIRLLVVDRLKPFINDDDVDVWERLGLSCCCGAAFSGCWLLIEDDSSIKIEKYQLFKLI